MDLLLASRLESSHDSSPASTNSQQKRKRSRKCCWFNMRSSSSNSSNLITFTATVILFLMYSIHLSECYTPVSRGCDERSCYPATGNLLIGRQDKLSATSTCGVKRRETYCILSHLDRYRSGTSEKCFWCDSTADGVRNRPRQAHRIENIVYRMEPPGEENRALQYRTWWQAENGQENVTIQLDLEAEFHVTHLIITFKTFRPAAMFIEKSYNWGKDWTVYRYFAADCARTFPGVHIGAPRYLNETVCQERYSRVTPSTLGSVIYRVLPPNINIHSPGFNPYSREVQDLLKTTNLRIHMTRLHTLGDENLEQTDRLDIKRKYYYAIYDMTVRGSCSCYGHAERCLPEKEEHKEIRGMVHGKCDCTHNTRGNNCEYCLDDHNDVPWRPATGKKKNECKKCNCHDHADSCFFNPYVYAATGNVSGGVCDNCTHNTEGRQCEFCKLGFYQDPILDLNHPEICKPCDCEPDGTVDEGLCDSITDESEGKEAGQCHCKTFVGGQRCDRCINGFWNFTKENPDGCQECTCNLFGIVSNDGCDQYNGTCTCKRFVVGRDCNQCQALFYGLSLDDPYGCKPCDCDIGGSLDRQCDVLTGQCVCRPNLTGRRCDTPQDGYFTGPLDFLYFEGEYATGSQNPPTKVIRREPSNIPGGTTWTGLGFMQTYEGSTLKFLIPQIFKNLEYDLVVRYEHQPNFPLQWEEASAELVRIDGAPDPKGKCANATDTKLRFKMSPDRKYSVVDPPVCLEEGQRYEIELTFDRYDQNNPEQKANILIDSIALIPRPDSMDIFQTTPEGREMLAEFERLGCRDYYLPAGREEEIPEECKNLLMSISFYTFNGALERPCECDQTGSESTLCDKYSGQCPCKRNINGRRCDRCEPGTFGFGADGCKPCNCHSLGSLDPFCLESNGQCSCKANAYGRRCNECQPGYWNFPNCQPCECNGHASVCEAETGNCIECRDWTDGFHCEVCKEGYYGDPRFGVDIPCRECPCPNTKASGHSFADRCYLDTNTNEPICECEEGYASERCSVCGDNYFGNPEIPGGSCIKCNCSGNWVESEAGNCDPSTGVCLQCQFNTEGDHCEYCKPGFWGDAPKSMCQNCVCNLLGTDPERFDCDRFTGDCHCLPNVEGRECDKCIKDHWKIASGEGCEPCACDPVGSLNATCNEYDGQCQCKEGFGGRKCDQCQENFWGDPRQKCFPCNCNPIGSMSYQCDHKNGTCVCLEGIGGEKCDECAVGFVHLMAIHEKHPVLNRKIPYGEEPRCYECGECFTNWERILMDLQGQTAKQVQQAETVRVTGVAGAYTRSFEDMEEKLQEVRDILRSASISNDELIGVQAEIDRISNALKDTTTNLDDLESDLADIRQSILQGTSSLEFLRTDSDALKLSAEEMREQITRLQEANVEGALNLTREAKRRSDEAAMKVRAIEADGGELKNSEVQRRATEKLMKNSRDQFSTTQKDNRDALRNIVDSIYMLESKIPDLNKQICDGTTSVDEPCDELCGGAGCDGKCGGLSCLNGALSKAEEALNSAKLADEKLVDLDRDAEGVLRSMTGAHQKTATALAAAQEAFDRANEAKNRSMGEVERIDEVSASIDEFTSSEDNARPRQVQDLAEECLAAQMDLTETEILELGQQINVAIDSVTNVDQILQETRGGITRAEDVNTRAAAASSQAQNQLKEAEDVTQSLSEASGAQEAAAAAVEQAQTDIDAARKDLAVIKDNMDEAIRTSDESVLGVSDLARRSQPLQTNFIRNEARVKSAREAANDAKEQASEANAVLYRLNNEFKNVSAVLEEKTLSIGDAKDLAVDLQRRANGLATSATNKLSSIFEVEKEYEETERRLQQLSDELVALNCEMMVHLQVIEDKSNYFRTCSPPSTWTPTTTCQCLPGQREPTCQSRRDLSVLMGPPANKKR